MKKKVNLHKFKLSIDSKHLLCYNARRMKKLIPVLVLALGVSSCAVKEVSRKELFTPTTTTLINSDELTKMKYYGCDGEYDYFTRGFSRLKVAKSQNAIPDVCRFTFNHWQGGKLYSDCIKEAGSNQIQGLQSLINAFRAAN